MAAARAARLRRGPALRVTAVVALGVSLATAALLAPGYEVQETEPVEMSVWVTRDDGRYARVNTDLGEFEAVQNVSDPTTVVQSGTRGMVFTQRFGRAWALTGADPADLVDTDGEGGGTVATIPSGTETVSASGGEIAYLTGAGEVFLGALPDADGGSTSPYQLDPLTESVTPDSDAPAERYVADAVAVGDDGMVAVYSSAEAAVRVYRVADGAFTGGPQALAGAPAGAETVEMAVVSGRWVLSAPESGRLWIEGLDDAIDTGATESAVLQSSGSGREDVLLSDEAGLVSVSLEDGTVERIVDSLGTPAPPVVVDGVAYAAWVSLTGGTLWASDQDGVREIEVLTEELDENRGVSPVFRANGDRAVLTETSSGMVWLVSDGTLLPVDEWAPLAETEEQAGTIEVDDVIEPEPPVAEDDVLGVRAGSVVSLPLLLNDHDPNSKDVLTIVPSSVTAIDEGFGEVGLVSDDQGAVIDVRATSGTATFMYSVTDGSATSSPATVTLTVIDDAVQTAPVWCGVENCVKEWPAPQIAPGGYTSTDVLSGWVDPEGDPVTLMDAVVDDPSAPVTVVPTSDGQVAIRHLDANATSETLTITVTVVDSRGATAQRQLTLRVTQTPALVARATAVTVGAGETATVTLEDMVSGGSGSYSLADAAPSTTSADLLSVLPSVADGTIDVSSTEEGSYTATYTVEDTVTGARQTAVLRVTVDSSPRALAAAPLTAFVRTGEDTTVDVLSAVTSSQGRVLMVQQATTDDSGLSVSVVDQTFVRVSATAAATDQIPLGIADILIADGTGAAVRTQLTVILIPSTHGVGPIAAPDTVTVRAGAQVDIPVLSNDVTPRGERLLLHPDVLGSDAPDELAFASGPVLRYVAPTVPGVYTLRYSAYLEGDAGRLDTATVTVTVLPEGVNSAPQPRDHQTRVLAGRSVTLTVDMTGIDPDGDSVTLVGVSQPSPGEGVATIGPSGRTLTYRAPAAGIPSGQIEFSYTVRDSQGATGTASVSVGVLSGELADVAPVTYGDNVTVELGSDAPVSVLPLINDRDPLQGELSLVELRPNVDETTDPVEYARLSALIDNGTDLSSGLVALLAGDVEGIHSYVYTVESQTSFSTAEGLIVVEVTDTPAPDAIQIDDTIVTLETRAALETDGLDVVTDQVRWATGEIEDLTLSLWEGAPAGFRVDGWRIRGSLPDSGALVPFALTGTDAAGNEEVGYGFLRIPAFDDMRLQPAAGLSAAEVGEEQSIDLSLRDMLGVAPRDEIQVLESDTFRVQRANATCTPSGETSVTYAAGREAPWTDTCSVPVRVSGQQTWTTVHLPLTIVPKDPQAVLGSLSRTVRPGANDSVDMLAAMVSWEGDRVGDVDSLDLRATYSGDSFVVVQQGNQLSIIAKADARPGTRETVAVTSAAYGGLSASVTLVVGTAKAESPVGATFSTQCDVSAGPCTVTVIGVAGEHDPYAGAPESGLTLVGVGPEGASTAACPVATVTVTSGSQVSLAWPSSERPPGGECVVDFVVADAQGATGRGTLTVDVLGYPQTPSSVVTQSYTPTSATLLVTLGQAAQAHPAVTSVRLYEGGAAVSAPCTAAGAGAYTCVVSGLVNGERHTYTARAVNSIGESLDTSPVTTWAYEAPTVESLTADPVYRASRTTEDRGVVSLTIGADDDVEGYLVVATEQVIARTGALTTAEILLPVGAQQLAIVPLSRYAPPTTGTNEGSASTTGVTVAGKPRFTAGAVTATASGTTLTVSSPAVDANYSTRAVTEVRAAWRTGTPTCTMSADGSAAVSGAEVTSTTATLSGLTQNVEYHVGVCASNGFGSAWLAASQTYLTWVAPGDPTGNSTYRVDTTPSWNDNVASFMDVTPPNLNVGNRFTLYYEYDGAGKSTEFTLSPLSVQTITAASCLTASPDNCGDPILVTPASGSPPTTVRATFPTECYADGADPSTLVTITAAARGSADITLDTVQDEYVVTFDGPFASLPDLRYPALACAPTPTPSATPNP
ncbi:Ig-like domain-containing protein [Demequina zhanjiangensis]|uniref:Ig-like domain-containing protein n=1 Tax=Demequina zhanjiangensis TaxID=3051659 RepID=A0ABT8FX64_9MICO|nr:Ig-like domain-containing protein [Demequina sp. SYSU T00b26]MDN4471491.1 Ig-like domain-containing protein [Demequina sp. SYSU T00b26]